MLSALASADMLTWLSICAKTLVYATALVAMGSVMALAALRGLPADEVQALRRLSLLCAIGAAVLSLARVPLQASFLMGGTWQGAIDPGMLGLVWNSPLGDSITLRLVGLGLIPAVLLPLRFARPLAAAGALIVAASFVFRGHALHDPRFLLAGLISAHILGLAFWIGGFAPLYRLARENKDGIAGRMSRDFGRIAVWAVGGLALAGAVSLWVLTGNLGMALATPYGQFFALKLGVFLAIIALAARNKMRLTPALLRQEPGACARLRRSIRMETALVALVLATTAVLTTLSAPQPAI